VGWHFVTFELPAEHVGRKVFLHFGAIDGLATIHVNGRRVGTHDGNTAAAWDEPFHFDVTGLVRTGDNDLALRVAANMQLCGPFRPISVVVK
jgi:beta-galactosidase/beta-glucuronidase